MGRFKKWLRTSLDLLLTEEGEAPSGASLISLDKLAEAEKSALLAATKATTDIEERLEKQTAAILKIRDAVASLQQNFNRIVSRSESYYQLGFSGRSTDRQNHALMLMAYLEYDQFIQAVSQFTTLDARVDAAVKWNDSQPMKTHQIYIYIEDLSIGEFIRPVAGEPPKAPWSQICSIFAKLPSTIFAQKYVKELYHNVPVILMTAPSSTITPPSFNEVTN